VCVCVCVCVFKVWVLLGYFHFFGELGFWRFLKNIIIDLGHRVFSVLFCKLYVLNVTFLVVNLGFGFKISILFLFCCFFGSINCLIVLVV